MQTQLPGLHQPNVNESNQAASPEIRHLSPLSAEVNRIGANHLVKDTPPVSAGYWGWTAYVPFLGGEKNVPLAEKKLPPPQEEVPLFPIKSAEKQDGWFDPLLKVWEEIPLPEDHLAPEQEDKSAAPASTESPSQKEELQKASAAGRSYFHGIRNLCNRVGAGMGEWIQPMLQNVAVGTATGMIEMGFGNLLLNIANFMVSLPSDIQEQIADRKKDLGVITEKDDLSTLLTDLTPIAIKEIDAYIVPLMTPQQHKLWESQKTTLKPMLEWMLHSGAVNLFNYMDKHPLAGVDREAEAQKMNPTQKLAYYLYSTLNPLFVASEEQIEQDIRSGKLALPDQGPVRTSQLQPFFEPLVDKLLQMAFGDEKTQGFNKTQRNILAQIKEVITARIAQMYRLNKRTLNDDLAGLHLETVRAALGQEVENSATVKLMDNTAKLLAGKLIEAYAEELYKAEFLAPYTAVTDYLRANPSEWKTQVEYAIRAVILKSMLKRVQTRSCDTSKELTPADALENLMGFVQSEFNKLSKDEIARVNKFEDPAKRLARMREIFQPAAQELYQALGSEVPIPFPALTKEIFENKVLNEFLPDQIAAFYNEWYQHEDVRREAKKSLENTLAHNHAHGTARVIANFTKDLVPQLLIAEKEHLAKLILNTAKEHLITLRLDAYIKAYPDEVQSLIAQHLSTMDEKCLDADAKNFIANHPQETREIVTAFHVEHALDTFLPTAAEVDDYLTANQDALQAFIAKNLEAIGSHTQIKNMLSLTAPMVETCVLKGLANVYQHVKVLDSRVDSNGQPEFLTNLVLKWLNTFSEFSNKVSQALVQSHVKIPHLIKLETMVANFGEVHSGVPCTPEALRAREVLKQQKQERQRLLGELEQAIEKNKEAKASLAKATKDIKTAVGKKISYAQKVILRAEKIIAQTEISKAAYRESLKATEKLIEDANAVIDPIREKYLKDVIENLMVFADITKAEDLPLPAVLQKKVWPILKDQLLPQVANMALKMVLDPHLQNQIVVALLQIVQEAEKRGGLDKIVYVPPADVKQAELNEAFGNAVLFFLKALPPSATYAALQTNGINKMTAASIGSIIRQQLGKKGAFLELVEKALGSGIPKLFEGSGWGKDDEQNPILRSAEGGNVVFKMPTTPEEKEAAAIQLAKEELYVAELVLCEIAKTVTGQMKKLVKSTHDSTWEFILIKLIRLFGGTVDDALPEPGTERTHRTHTGLWKDLQEVMDATILEHLGNFGMHVKRFADKVCRFLFLTVAAAILKMIAPPLYNRAFAIVEFFIYIKAKSLTKTMRMDILEDLYMHMLGDFLNMINNPEDISREDLVETATRNADAWINQEQGEEFQDIVALKNEIIRAQAEEPAAYNGKLSRLLRQLKERLKGTPLVRDQAPLVPAGDDEAIREGQAKLSSAYDVQLIAPDGHSLFRGVALELFHHIQEKDVQANPLLERIDAMIVRKEAAYENHLNSPQNQLLEASREQGEVDTLRQFKTLIQELLTATPSTPKEMILDPTKSNLAVKALRIFACEENKAHRYEQIEQIAAGECHFQTADLYFAQISNMNNPQPGGEPELQALTALGISITLLDVSLIGQNQNGTRQYRSDEDSSQPTITLLYNTATRHYDIARARPVIVEEEVEAKKLAPGEEVDVLIPESVQV